MFVITCTRMCIVPKGTRVKVTFIYQEKRPFAEVCVDLINLDLKKIEFGDV
jgi:hypothetical protein